MNMDIGESLLLSYLKHVKKCVLCQANWSPSSEWTKDHVEGFQILFSKMEKEFPNAFKSGMKQTIKQAEIDVIGFDKSNNIVYAFDIAFHESGLNYGGKEESVNRVIKKLLRSYIALNLYFPDATYRMAFVSPVVGGPTHIELKEAIGRLNTLFSSSSTSFEYIANESFYDQVLLPTLEISNSNATEPFLRSVKLLRLFDLNTMPNDICDSENKCEFPDSQKVLSDKLSLEFYPQDEQRFKELLIQKKRAMRTWIYADGSSETDMWRARNFGVNSNLRGNIHSTNRVRNREQNNLVKIILEIRE